MSNLLQCRLGHALSITPTTKLLSSAPSAEYTIRFDSQMAGGGEAPMQPPTPPSSQVVCCMCGDYGLHHELFQCMVCITRSQHKYCSDLYPRAGDYLTCNWCLRDDGRKPVTDNSSSTPNHEINNPNGSSGGPGLKLQRGPLPSHLSKPVKKPRLLIRSQSDVGHRAKQEELSHGLGRGRQVMRGRLRRYKLLEEVSN